MAHLVGGAYLRGALTKILMARWSLVARYENMAQWRTSHNIG
ncbi:hypothetical protein Nizo1838_2102 [Lactiplantibacillus plantarum]|nr:hypothetical protein Nizo1838_2102 [Lactiplantibacillus plantarum]KZT90239.1 hypothetical protein Nizo2256_1223 [Lactiplantibacillus plantarum]